MIQFPQTMIDAIKKKASIGAQRFFKTLNPLPSQQLAYTLLVPFPTTGTHSPAGDGDLLS